MSEQGFLRREPVRTASMNRSRRIHISRYDDPDSAPFNKPVMVEVDDGNPIGPYRLPFQVMQTIDGWRNAKNGHLLAEKLKVTGWKYAEGNGRIA